MQDTISPTYSRLFLAWLATAITLISLAAYILLSYFWGTELQQPLAEPQRILLRTTLYAIAIITLPVTNLIRHISLRLNQTMPLTGTDQHASASRRYLTTVIISLALIESIGLSGFIMFILGDGRNTLYIFIVMSALGLFLYRPKMTEYQQVVTALAESKHG